MTVSCAGAKVFDYQSDRHRSKTRACALFRFPDLITSQIDTAPKLVYEPHDPGLYLITSQIDTAPKPRVQRDAELRI